jgi:predicted RNA-binding Zn-ribbon protein involved in translation (DUF1610 family)
MKSQEKFSLLKSILRTLGLSASAVEDIIDRVVDFMFDREAKPEGHLDYPYHLRDDFLSNAELNFYLVLKKVVSDKALICTKVDLGDLFYVKSTDPSRFRIYTNKIDRKHVDYLLCDTITVKPLVGIELDDKSHQKSERQARDEFVEKVFEAAELPLIRFPVQRSYSGSELESVLRPYFSASQEVISIQPIINEKGSTVPLCPKCGSAMVLRTAKTGLNQGGQFWGCHEYPRCRGILKYESVGVS